MEARGLDGDTPPIALARHRCSQEPSPDRAMLFVRQAAGSAVAGRADFRPSTPGTIPSQTTKWSRTRPGSAWTMRVPASAEMPATRGHLGRWLGLAALRLIRLWLRSGPRLAQVCSLR